jgi:O-antigen ligase
MITGIYLLAVFALLLVAFTRRSIWVIAGFYFVYGTLKILAIGKVLDLGQLVLFRMVYLALFVAVFVRLIKDREFIRRIHEGTWISYLCVVAAFLGSSLYSQSSHSFAPGDPFNVWGYLLVYSLFWLAAAQVRSLNDVTVFAWSTVLVSVTLSAWVIWSAATLKFENLRGGIDVNQNFVSVLVLVGTLALLYQVVRQRGFWTKSLLITLLLPMVLASFILASRGMVAAFLLATLVMFLLFSSSRGYKNVVVLMVIIAMLFGVALLLPGGSGILARIQAGEPADFNARPQVWAFSLHHFAEAGPLRMLFGNGYASALVILGPVFTDDLWNYHNELLYRLMDEGLVGLAAFVAFLYSVGRRAYRTPLPVRNLTVGWLVLLVGAGLTSTIADSHPFWILTGIITGASMATAPAGATDSGAPPVLAHRFSGS